MKNDYTELKKLEQEISILSQKLDKAVTNKERNRFITKLEKLRLPLAIIICGNVGDFRDTGKTTYDRLGELCQKREVNKFP